MSDNGNEWFPDKQLAFKDVEQQQQQSIQERARQQAEYGFSLLSFLAQGSSLIPAWWSKARDAELAKFWIKVPHLAGAFYTLASKLAAVPFRIEARDSSVKAHNALAEQFQQALEEESEFGQGWQQAFTLFLLDLWTQDNGAFWEVIGAGKPDGPIQGPALGIAHLDSYRCTRTGSADYPVVYQDTDGKLYKLHRSRVIYISQMPSPRVEMHRVGFCWTSRVVDVAQNILDILTYKQEKLGSRPTRGLIVTQGGIDPDTLTSAFKIAEMQQSAQGLSRYSKYVVIGDAMAPEAALQMVDLASLPDGFDERTSTELAMFTIALTGGIPPRWLWPATTSGATKADAMYQHVAGIGGGAGATLSAVSTALGGSERGLLSASAKFLPPTLRMVFDFQDDEQDRDQAEIRDIRSQQRERDLNSGVFTVRVAREQAVESGDLSQAQFEQMELDEGRLPDGTDVLTLFYSRDPQIQGMLTIDAEYDDALDIEANDATLMGPAIEKQLRICQQVSVLAPNASLKRKAQQCEAALKKLGELYKPPPEPPVPPPMLGLNGEELTPVAETPDDEQPEEPELDGDQGDGSERLLQSGAGGRARAMVGRTVAA